MTFDIEMLPNQEAAARVPAAAVLRASALLSGGWIVSLIVGLVSAKAMAVMLGPAGVGYLGLLQSTLALAALVTAIGAGAGLVPVLGRARRSGSPAEEAAARATAWWLWFAVTAVSAALLISFRSRVADLFLGSPTRANAILPLAAALVLTQATSVQTNILSAYQRIRELARLGIANSLVGPALLLPMVWRWSDDALPSAILAGAFASFAMSRYVVRGIPVPAVRADRRDLVAATRRLLRVGLTFNASAIAGTGIQMTIPVLVLHALGSADVGFYRAAVGLSVLYLGFVGPIMGQEYYPRVSACVDDRDELQRVVNNQARFILLLAGPVILAMLTAAPYLAPIVYTTQFTPMVPLLEWQLVGDIAKVASLALGFAILGRMSSRSVVADLITGGLLVVFAWIGMRAFALQGLGVALVVNSVCGLFLYAWMLHRATGVRLTRDTWRLLMGLLLAALLIRAISSVGFEPLRIATGLIASGAAASLTLRMLRSDLGSRH